MLYTPVSFLGVIRNKVNTAVNQSNKNKRMNYVFIYINEYNVSCWTSLVHPKNEQPLLQS